MHGISNFPEIVRSGPVFHAMANVAIAFGVRRKTVRRSQAHIGGSIVKVVPIACSANQQRRRGFVVRLVERDASHMFDTLIPRAWLFLPISSRSGPPGPGRFLFLLSSGPKRRRGSLSTSKVSSFLIFLTRGNHIRDGELRAYIVQSNDVARRTFAADNVVERRRSVISRRCGNAAVGQRNVVCRTIASIGILLVSETRILLLDVRKLVCAVFRARRPIGKRTLSEGIGGLCF